MAFDISNTLFTVWIMTSDSHGANTASQGKPHNMTLTSIVQQLQSYPPAPGHSAKHALPLQDLDFVTAMVHNASGSLLIDLLHPFC